MQKTIRISFKNKDYEVETDKLVHILEKLENTTIKKSEEEIMKLFEKYSLYDEVFLKEVNKLW